MKYAFHRGDAWRKQDVAALPERVVLTEPKKRSRIAEATGTIVARIRLAQIFTGGRDQGKG